MPFGQVEPREVREFRLGFLRPHIGPHHPPCDPSRIGLDLHRFGQFRVLRLRRRIEALAVDVEFPTVKQAAQPALLIDAERKGGSAVRTMFVKQAAFAFAVHEADQVLAHQPDTHRLAVGREFVGQHGGHPEAPHEIAHRSARADPAEQFVVFVGEHLTEPVLLDNNIFYLGLPKKSLPYLGENAWTSTISSRSRIFRTSRSRLWPIACSEPGPPSSALTAKPNSTNCGA